MLQIRCKNNNITKSFPEGTSLLEVYQDYAEELKMPFPVVSAKVNNTSQGLKFRLFQNRDVEFLDAREGSGRRDFACGDGRGVHAGGTHRGRIALREAWFGA